MKTSPRKPQSLESIRNYPGFSTDDETALRELVDAAFSIVSAYAPTAFPMQKQWRDNWLRRANEIVPQGNYDW